MDFELPWEVKTLQQTVRQFVERGLIPIEIRVNQHEELSDDVLRPLQEKVKALGLWLLDVPKGHGGAGLGLLERCVIQEEISKTKALPFRHNELFGPVVGPILYHCNASTGSASSTQSSAASCGSASRRPSQIQGRIRPACRRARCGT